MYHSIRVTDPEEPLNQMFVLLKADALLHSQAGKEAWQYTYAAGQQPGVPIYPCAGIGAAVH